MTNDVRLTDYNAGMLDNNSRLGDTLKLYRKVTGRGGDRDLYRLHTHKGQLTCFWLREPTDWQETVIQQSWEYAAQECAENVAHSVFPHWMPPTTIVGQEIRPMP